MNPVLLREWRYFFRGRSPYYFMIFYAMLHLLIFYGAMMPVLHRAAVYDNSLKGAGRILAGRLFAAQLLLIIFAFPPIAVRLMTRERDEDMHELLLIAPYGFTKVIFHKLIISFFIWMLLVLIALPLFLLSLSTGGISMKELALLLGSAAAFVFFCGGTGFLSSSLFKKPAYSLSSAYLFIFVASASYLAYPSSITVKFLSFSF
ncbi:MAG: ABC transporter permease [Nitrospirae bacterium]|nr:ABC transporter permease [Nitrospirota bacterium]